MFIYDLILLSLVRVLILFANKNARSSCFQDTLCFAVNTSNRGSNTKNQFPMSLLSKTCLAP